MSRHTDTFVYEHALIVSGLIVCEDVEIEGRVTFTVLPGSPETGPSYASGGEPATDPEIEIDEIEVYGHPDTTPDAKPRYAALAPSDPLWQQIAGWLIRDRADDLFSTAREDIREARSLARRPEAA